MSYRIEILRRAQKQLQRLPERDYERVRDAMTEITLEIPEETLEALKLNPENAGAMLRLAAAAKLFKIGRLSSGAAAGLAGVPRTVFLTKLADFGVDTFRLNREDLEDELRFG